MPPEVVVAHVLCDVLLRSQLLSLDQAQMASKPNFWNSKYEIKHVLMKN